MESLQDLIATAKQDENTRSALLADLRAAVQELETPQEVFWRMLVEPHAFAVVRAAIKLELFQHLHKSGSLSSNQLARCCGADELLVVRLARVLTAMGILKEIGLRQYENAVAGTVLATDIGMRSALNFMCDHTLCSTIVYRIC